ncbi:NADPH oxidase organizer 1 [Sarotherodon galilaeus]
MACTSQSAKNYVKTARVHLVRELKNLSVIVQNLNQKGVLGEEEVSLIQAEKTDENKRRMILDSIIKKGEEACYELLKIIDMTRKRTLGRLPFLSEKANETSRETKFDLHHWISCFSFKEEPQMDRNYLQGPRPCHRYQEKLKLKVKKILNDFWASSKNLFEENKKPDLLYISLILDTQSNASPTKIKKLKKKKSKLSRPKKLRTYIPEEKPDISPCELLKTDKNILLVGKPGIGKTALTHEMLRLWAERESGELDYMFYFDMREKAHIMNVKNLEDLLFTVFSEPDEGKDEVLQDIKRHSDNVTIIFDGLTDLSSSVVEKLLNKDLLPLAKIIITCRADDEDEDLFSGNFDRVEVKGFSEQTIKTYFSATLGEDQKKVLSNLELITLCHVPMYALMVAACFSSKHVPQPCTITEIYINIVRFCLQINSKTKKKDLNSFISTKTEEILSLAEVAFLATQQKSVNLTNLTCKDICVLSFLKPLLIKEAVTETIATYAFLHYTVQEFFAALWLLKNPDKIRDVFQQCLKEEKKHMKHLIPFMCRLLNEKSPSLMKHLIPDQDLKNTSNWFFKELINTFHPHLCEQEEADTEDSGLHVDILFLCQCLYESQSPEACIYLLDKLDYHLDLSGESLDPYPCCAVAYVVTQSKERKIRLNLEDVIISEQGMRQLFGCLENVEWYNLLPQQLWKAFLLSEEQMDFVTLLSLDGNHLHLPTQGEKQLFERAVEVMQWMSTKVNVCLYWDRETPACQSLCESLLEALPFISSLSFRCPFFWSQEKYHGTLEKEQENLFMDLCLKAALNNGAKFYNVAKKLLSLFHVKTELENILLDLYQHIKSRGFSVNFETLRPCFQSTPAVWSINLSERKTSILLEVLKLQPEKKQVKLTGCSHEESEVRSFLQCLPYISQLSVDPICSDKETRFFGNLFCAAAEREQQTGEKILELLSSSTPAVWSINLSERKTSILLEVLKLQPEKKQVELTGCSHEESEVRSFLQCLPYISQLSVIPWKLDEEIRFFGSVFCAAAEREQQTGEKILELLSSVCTYKGFPVKQKLCDFLVDLYSYETKTGSSILPSLQSVFQSAPAVWSINLSLKKTSILLEVLKLQPDKKQVKLTGCSHEESESAPAVWSINLSERKTSILLEVLKLQPEKKPVELRGCSNEDSEVKSFLECLPYISQLSFHPPVEFYKEARFFGNLFCAAAEREHQTGEKILELLSSACSFETFPLNNRDMGVEENEYQSDFLLDLYSHVKDCETKTGLSVLPSLHSVFQSAPAVWSINLSERKTSILLEVLKLQPEKKQVKLTGCSHEESEVRSFLQCLPYISQLSVDPENSDFCEEAKFFGNLFCAAAEREQQTGEEILELLSSVCTYERFPLKEKWCDFLMDLCSYETKADVSILPSLQSVIQSAPAVWSINLSERKTSILLEVLKLQPEKKHVELTGCSHEESEVRSFLECLPYISQLSFFTLWADEGGRFFGNLFCAAAEREEQTGEKILELLSSVCTYPTFPVNDTYIDLQYQCDFLLDLYSHVKDREIETGLSFLPSLQSVFQSAPAVWFINLSIRKTFILLEVLKLQLEKKQVKLTGCSHEESEVRSFLDCLPYISQLSVASRRRDEEVTTFVKLFCAAAEREQQTGEKILELLSSVCRYERLPLKEKWCDFLMDMYSYEIKTGLSVLPSLKSVFQSAPAVWSINLSERKTSILLEVLKLQPEKKQVELTGCSHEESEVRRFLQCLPYISQLSVDPETSDEEAVRFFVNLFCAAAEREQQTGEKILELLSSVCTYPTFPFNERYVDDDYQCDFLLNLYTNVRDCETKTGLSVLPSFQSVFQSAPAVWSINLSERKTSILLEVLKLQPEKKQVELTGCSHEESEVRSFLQCLPYISQLRLSIDMSLLLFQWVRRGRVVCPLAVEELSLVPKKARPSQRVMLRAVSSLASLLRYWTVARLDLTETCIPAQGLITLLLHDGPLTVKLSEESFQQLLCLLHEIQDKDLTLSFLSKVGGDLTSCCLNWELLHYLLQQASAQTITVNLRKNLFLQEETTRLLPFLDRIVFKRPSPSFVMSSIRELYRAHDSHAVPSLLRSLGHVINLSSRELDSVDCAGLIFILKHGDGVKLNLLWTSIPAEGVESILFMLDKVSHLSVDRNQLLRFIHCCAACDVQQEAASGLLRTLQHSLDLSCSSCVELPEEDQPEPLSLTADDCRAVSTILTHSSRDTQLDLRDCEVEDSVLDLLFPVLHRVRLRVSKTVLLQLLSLVPVNSERDTVRRAVSLCRALGGELDLSHSTLDQRACGALVQMLDSCEGLTELDLSHCQLTDQLLLPLITHLHKVQVLDLSHNQITDASTDVLLQLLSINPSIDCVRLYSNNIVHRAAFKEHKQFEIAYSI